jgi:hypothetical protein
MNFKFLSYRVKNIILNPARAWSIIYSENRPLKYVRGSFLLPLIILVALSAFLGSVLFTHTGFLKIYSFFVGVKYFFLLLFTVYSTSFIFMKAALFFELNIDFTVSFKIIAYAAAPFLICQILSRMIESFIFINILAFYGLYIFWFGVEMMINPPSNRKLPLMVTAFSVFLIILVTVNWLLTFIIDKIYFAYFT